VPDENSSHPERTISTRQPGLRGAGHRAALRAEPLAELSLVDGLARKIEFPEPDQAVSTCPVPLEKIFGFSFYPNHF
jgi:hypothetical protein